MKQSQNAAQEIHSVAAAAVRRDPRVNKALGGPPVECSAPLSVSSSSSSVNGVTTSTTEIQFIAQGSAGRQAPVSVRATSGRPLEIVVQLPSGAVRVDAGGGAGGGGGGGGGGVVDPVSGVIDVEAREVK